MSKLSHDAANGVTSIHGNWSGNAWGDNLETSTLTAPHEARKMARTAHEPVPQQDSGPHSADCCLLTGSNAHKATRAD